MGCCGCDSRTTVQSAGIFAILQCIFAVILSSYSINYFSNYRDSDLRIEKLFRDLLPAYRTMLILNILLQLVWMGSSIVLMRANTRDHIWGIRQWLISTSTVIICDVVFPSIVIGVTFKAIAEMIRPGETITLGGNYFVLLWSFTRLGLITWITNIVFCVHVGRRIEEILRPNTGFVIAQAVPAQMIQPGQAYYPTSPGQPPFNQPQPYGQFQQPQSYGQPQPAYGNQPPPVYSEK